MNILHIDASSRSSDSVSRKLSQAIVEQLSSGDTELNYRDVSSGLPYVDEAMIGAYYTPKDQRSDEQNKLIELSDQIVSELMTSNTIVIGVPMYNFGPPASLKAWADLAARVGETFKYTDTGPVGLLENKKAYISIATGGAEINSPVDFLTPWLKQFLGFIGIDNIEIIKAEALNRKGPDAVNDVLSEIEKIS